ncbi:hypothetical protein NPIL_674621 [Nephila pilipes]|uniref:Uncharacterized protein n=1 Tax=Nephila pilipes TaxID=299642 RepID=A0A8X6QU21_NEPPI|nr:hypothetical protein NPIL_674621 [Nephila pilipes]
MSEDQICKIQASPIFITSANQMMSVDGFKPFAKFVDKYWLPPWLGVLRWASPALDSWAGFEARHYVNIGRWPSWDSLGFSGEW